MISHKHRFDILIRDYFKNIPCFCDFLNGIYFQGKPIIHERDIRHYDGEYSGQFLNKEYTKRSRDNMMSVQIGHREYLVAFEHQSTYDGSMLHRVMEYDYLTYRRQYLDYKNSHRKKKIAGTMTFVFYYGYKKWKGL